MANSNALRWRVVVGGIISNFCAGMLYSWSIYVKPLMAKNDWDQGSVALTMSIATMVIPISMIPAAKILAKQGPAKTALLGALFYVVGLVISGFANSLPLLYLGYGILGGIGVGFIYGTPVATCIKWFPDKKGLISGLAVGGFGLGSIVFAPIVTNLVGNALLDNGTLSPATPEIGFWVQAGIALVGMLIGAPMMKAAPDGFKPEGWNPPATSVAAGGSHDYTSSEMLKTKQYWFLLIMYLFANMSGLMVIGQASPIAQTVAGLSVAEAGAIVSLLSIFNTAGRFMSGALCDKLGAKRVVTIIYVINAILLVALQFLTNFVTIAIGIGGLAICFGAMMGAYPSLVVDYFGVKYSGANYARIFLAYGIGGIIGPQIAVRIFESTKAAAIAAGADPATATGNYTMAFIIIGASCIVGAVMSIISKKPVYKG